MENLPEIVNKSTASIVVIATALWTIIQEVRYWITRFRK